MLLLLLGGAVVLGALALPALIPLVGGNFEGDPEQLGASISPDTRKLIDAAYEGVDHTRLFDYHTHIAGLGTGSTGAWVNPEMTAWSSPMKRAKFAVYLSASGVNDLADADAKFVARLADLVRGFPRHGRHGVMAFDRYYRPDGSINEHKTEFHIPNEYSFALAAAHPDIFVPIMSVHPYRKDALSELEKWAARGGRVVKWLPNAMGMSPDDPAIDPYYRKMAELDLILLSHAGEEQAVDAAEDQQRGNPLRFRRPLDLGVKVVIAHCASLGASEDLDAPGGELVSNFELFMRLMEDPRYEGLLFADISAMTQWNRVGVPLTTMLDRQDLHGRLVNGSDYPLPAINALISTAELQRQGYISADEREALNEIYAFNPLLFDFVTKRTLRSPVTGARFAASVFEEHEALAPTRPAP